MPKVAERAAALAHLTDRVTEVSNDHVLQVGEILQVGREELGRAVYERWVAERLPFSLTAAERYRAVYLAVTNLPDAPLPAPHRALYAVGLGQLPERAVGPCLTADELASDLIRYDASEVSPRLRVVIEAWLVGYHESSSVGGGGGGGS